MKKAIYLKINRKDDFALKIFSHWLDIAYLLDVDCYILCDNDEVTDLIKEKLILCKEAFYIKSDKSEKSRNIVENIAIEAWENAGYAHLTTFFHAQENNYSYFWNIDADDTLFCLSLDRTVELLKCVEEYAENNKIDCFSLDMWRTQCKGEHWSFGVTYTKARTDWQKMLFNHCRDNDYKNDRNGRNFNIDCYFSFLKKCTDLSIETFYCENLKFVHYSTDFFAKPFSSAFYHWKDGKLLYPLIYYCFGIEKKGIFDIWEDVIKFDINIKDEEAKNSLTYNSDETSRFNKYINWQYFTNAEVCRKKIEIYMSKYNKNVQIVYFCAGKYFKEKYKKILHIYDVKYICDNDFNKWGTVFEDGMVCISPEELKKMDNILVIIWRFNKSSADDIVNQLKGMGIINYDFAQNWLKFFE